MSRNRIISLPDVQECPASVTAFYDRFRGKTAEIETIAQRNDILSCMQEDFERAVLQEPQIRDQMSDVYQLLKKECWEAVS